MGHVTALKPPTNFCIIISPEHRSNTLKQKGLCNGCMKIRTKGVQKVANKGFKKWKKKRFR